MSLPSFQKVEMPNGKKYTITRSGIGQPEKEFVVNEVSHRGSVFQTYGTYDECMDFISELAEKSMEVTAESNIVKAVRDAADKNFHRELG